MNQPARSLWIAAVVAFATPCRPPAHSAEAPAAPDIGAATEARLRAVYERGKDLAKEGKHAEAAAEYEKAVRLSEQIHGKDHLTTAGMLNLAAYQWKEAGDRAKAAALCARVLAIQEARLGRDHERTRLTRVNLFRLYDLAGGRLFRQGRHEEAIRPYGKAAELARRIYGEDHIQTARALNNLGYQYNQIGEYAKAEPLFLRALRINEVKLGPDHPYVAICLDNLGSLYSAVGEYAKAEPKLRRGLEIRKAKLPGDHLHVGMSLNNLGLLCYRMGRFAKAEPLYLQSLGIKKAKLGNDHPSVGTALNNLAELYRAMRDYAKAEPLYLRSLAIYKHAKLPGDHPYLATSLNNLGLLYTLMLEYAKAEPPLRRALAIREARFGGNHLSVATSLNSLAGLYHDVGQYAKAEPLLLRCLSIREARLGKDHPLVAASLNDLGWLYRDMGRYARAEPLCIRSLAIREARLGRDHPQVGESLNSLALLYQSMGDYAKAEPLYLRALAIMEARLGRDHLTVAVYLNNVGYLYTDMGEYGKSEPRLRRALAIREARLGRDHFYVAISLNNLAMLYADMDQHARAEALLLRSLAIKEAKLGRDHPSVAVALKNLAGLYHDMGQYAKVEPLLLRALAIWEAKAGKGHPRVGVTLYCLSLLHARRGDYERAWPLARRAMEILVAARSRAGRSPLGRASFLHSLQYDDLPVCVALKAGRETDVLGLLEQLRAVALHELLDQARFRAADLLGEADRKRVLTALARINALNTAIRNRLEKGQSTETARQELRRAEREYDGLIAELRGDHEQLVATETAEAISSERITRSPALESDTAVVGWVEYMEWSWGYVIRTGGVHWVDLSEGLDQSIDRARRRRILACGRGSRRAALSADDLSSLYRGRFGPLEPHLRGVRKLVVIAQGWTAQLPVEMLLTAEPAKDAPMSDWPWLGAKYEVSYAPSCTTLDRLCRQREKRKAKRWSRMLFALADPPFSAEQLAAMEAEKTVPAGPQLAAPDGEAQMLRQAVRFDPNVTPQRLPGTRREARMVSRALGAGRLLMLLGPEACERRLFELSRTGELRKCRYVHLATHGYADADRPELSGLMLARVPADPNHDGVLHMREVFHLKLDADLVVLSACRTGLGRQLRGEGVVGLSTAFFFAGTPSLVMSLWDVRDDAAALLMQRFYRNLAAGRTKATALSEAKAWLCGLTRDDLLQLGRKDAVVAQLARGLGDVVPSAKGSPAERKKTPFAHPHYWAGFILTGDPK